MNVTCAAKKGLATAVVAMAVAGCQSGPPTAEPASAADQSAALAIVAQAQAITALPTLRRGPGTAHALAVAIDVVPAIAVLSPAGWSAYPATDAPSVRDHAATGDALAACMTATARAASFTDCALGGHLVDGTTSRSGAAVTAQLDDVVIDPAHTGAASVHARLAGTTDTLWGTLDIDATWAPGTSEVGHPALDPTIDVTIRFDGISTDADGCPTAGHLAIAGSWGPPETEVARTFVFGPTCGDVAVIE
ncbi:MAG TPA: hypothetical protein VFG83_08860 [Kofleriaceae bacterium]|nr:hypothetical protein [Kofleriaceae bacterium]